jgi:hypothetical protein
MEAKRNKRTELKKKGESETKSYLAGLMQRQGSRSYSSSKISGLNCQSVGAKHWGKDLEIVDVIFYPMLRPY